MKNISQYELMQEEAKKVNDWIRAKGLKEYVWCSHAWKLQIKSQYNGYLLHTANDADATIKYLAEEFKHLVSK